MPLPWEKGTGAFAAKIIPRVENRALTLTQLRAIRTFLQHLYKSGQLRYTNSFLKHDSKYGTCIQWCEINQYDICNEVIIKVIPHVDPSGETCVANQRWYSWAEFVATADQPADIFMSHFWGGRFRDMLVAIEKLAQDRDLSAFSTLWVCTFANCQFGDDFSSMGLEGCAFIKSVGQAHLTVLMIDRNCGSLFRSWCGIELHYTIEQGKELNLYSPTGRVGMRGTCSGPLVEAVKEWDIRKGAASEPAYRRRILNYVAGVDENFGVKSELDENRRPQLEDDSKMMDGKEYKHEDNLFRAHAKRFEDLNTLVRLEVMATIGRYRRPKGCHEKQYDLRLRGITLGQIRSFWKRFQEAEREDAADSKCMSHFSDVCAYVRKITLKLQCSYMESVAETAQRPQIYFAYQHRAPFQHAMAALDWYAEAEDLSDSSVFLFDLLSHNLHNDVETAGDWGPGWRKALQECTRTVVALSPDIDLSQAIWLQADIHEAFKAGQDVCFACPSGVRACSQPFKGGSWVQGNFDLKVAHILTTAEFYETAKKSPNAKALMEIVPGIMDVTNQRRKCFELDCRLAWIGAGTVLSDAARKNDCAKILAISRRPGFWINSRALTGALGDTALHVAAAAGHAEAIRTLVQVRMDPNIDDLSGERPLHYAARAGQTDAARELLSRSADPWATSRDGAKPLQLAKEAAASFLGVGYEAVQNLLDASEQVIHQQVDSGLNAGAISRGDRVLEQLLVQLRCHEPWTGDKLAVLLEKLGVQPEDLQNVVAAAPGMDKDMFNIEAFAQWLYEKQREACVATTDQGTSAKNCRIGK